MGFVNYKWTEILVEDEVESQEIDRNEVKKAIIQMMKREENNPLDDWTDKFIRVKHKTYVPVEVAKDRNGRMIYTPIIPTDKPKISFGAAIRKPNESDNDEHEQQPTLNNITEVEYPRARRACKKMQNSDIKINVDVEIINKGARNNHSCNKQHQLYRSCLTKKELLDLINEEISLDEEQSINLVEIIDQTTLAEYPQINTKHAQRRRVMYRHEVEFAARFSSAVEQIANEGIGLSLPIVVIEHIYNSECNLSVVRSQARKCAKEGMPNKDEDDEYYFSLLKVKEVTQVAEKESTPKKKKELMMILRCKNKAANYAIF